MDESGLFIVISLTLSAIFSAVEIAFISANRLYIEVQSQKNTLTGRILAKFVRNSKSFISTILIGNTLSLVIYGIYMEGFLSPYVQSAMEGIFGEAVHGGSFDIIILVIQTILSTIVVLGIAEFLPKSISLAIPHSLLNVTAVLMNVIYILLKPIVYITVTTANFLLKHILKIKTEDDSPAFGITELSTYIKGIHQENTIESADIDVALFENVIAFNKEKVRDCMIPRLEIIAVNVGASREDLLSLFIQTGKSKILVYEETIDNIIGYVHPRDFIQNPSKSISEMMKEILIVPETTSAKQLMVSFSKWHKSIALVVDEYGGTSGIVTTEDILEEIVGEINDEHDAVNEIFTYDKSTNTYTIFARAEIEEINEKFDWKMPKGDYDTLGGFIIHLAEKIPTKGEIFENNNFKFEIIDMDGNRIEYVRLSLKNEKDTE